jgi:hypothetical protein
VFFRQKSRKIISGVKYLKMNELKSVILQFKHLNEASKTSYSVKSVEGFPVTLVEEFGSHAEFSES